MFVLFFKCFRKFAFAWFNNQSNFIIIQKFDRDLTCTFFIISFEFIAKLFIFISNFSSQYYSCVECFVHFSSIIRFLKHTKQISCSKMICKYSEQNFNFKNKFHEHIREQHIQKSNINSNFRFFISKFTYKIKKKSTIVYSSILFILFVSSVLSIFFATFTSIFESILLKFSNFFIATFNITSKSIKKLSINCSFTFSISFFRTFFRIFVSKHQKFYFIIDNLIRMFREKFKSIDLSQHQKRRFFSQNIDVRSFVTYQFRIIVYFLFAINQKTSISQNLKNSNSKNFQQFTFAKTIRFVLFEKSIILLYKKSNIFYILLQSKFSSKFSFLQSRFSFVWFRFTFSFTFSSFFRFLIANHICCICFDHFNFRNDLFNYSRFNQRYFSNRRSMKKIKKMINRFETKLKKNEK